METRLQDARESPRAIAKERSSILLIPEIRIAAIGAAIIAAVLAAGMRFSREDPECLELAKNAMQRFSRYPEDPSIAPQDCGMAHLILIDADELAEQCGPFKFVTTRTAAKAYDVLLRKAHAQCPAAIMAWPYAAHDAPEHH